MKRKQTRYGFTLVELMIVVMIIGVLAAVAAQVYRRFVLRSRSGEAHINLKHIKDGLLVHYSKDRIDASNGQPLPKEFISAPATPSAAPCTGGLVQYKNDFKHWNQKPWRKLSFAISKAHYYQYSVISSGVALQAKFNAMAKGDLDCDGTLSTFSLRGSVSQSGGTLPKVTGMIITNELE